MLPIHIAVGRMTQGLLAVVFNSITVFCVLKFRFLQNSSNITVASLACSDMLHGLGSLVFIPLKEYILPKSDFILVCYILIGSESTLIIVQFAMFALMSIERFTSLRAAIGQGKKWGNRKLLGAVALSWCAGFIYCGLAYIFPRTPSENDLCTPKSYSQPIVTYVGAGFFVTCTGVTLCFYVRIARLYAKRNNQVAASIPTYNQIKKRKTEYKVAKMLAMVVGVFFLLYLPFVAVLSFIKPDSPARLFSAYHYMVLLIDINFWINPVIYAWRSMNFRKAFSSLFKCGVRRPTIGANSSTPNTNVAVIQLDVVAPVPDDTVTVTRAI